MYECIINVTLLNEWSKETYSQVHGSLVLKTLSFKFTCIFALFFVCVHACVCVCDL